MYFPWMMAMSMEILLMVGVGLWYIVRYYRNVSVSIILPRHVPFFLAVRN